MSLDIPANQLPIYAFEVLILLGGLAVWGWFQLRAAGARWRQARLQPWRITPNTFLIVCLEVVLGSVAGAIVFHAISTLLPKTVQSDAVFMVMLTNLGLHLGAVGGAVYASKKNPDNEQANTSSPSESPAGPALSTPKAIYAGILTFLAAVVAIAVVSLLWQTLLTGLGIPAEKQELLDIFKKTGDPLKLAVMSCIAVVVAPLAEELAFRAGLFRYLRTRLPRWVSFVLPATLFALLHFNVAVLAPLFVLGLIFSVAYERTGRILVTVIAHGLFNLNTIVLILLNVNM